MKTQMYARLATTSAQTRIHQAIRGSWSCAPFVPSGRGVAAGLPQTAPLAPQVGRVRCMVSLCLLVLAHHARIKVFSVPCMPMIRTCKQHRAIVSGVLGTHQNAWPRVRGTGRKQLWCLTVEFQSFCGCGAEGAWRARVRPPMQDGCTQGVSAADAAANEFLGGAVKLLLLAGSASISSITATMQCAMHASWLLPGQRNGTQVMRPQPAHKDHSHEERQCHHWARASHHARRLRLTSQLLPTRKHVSHPSVARHARMPQGAAPS